MKRQLLLASAVIAAFIVLSTSAFAAENTPLPAEGLESTELQIPPVQLYPSEVVNSDRGGIPYTEKIYYLATKDTPASIPTESFTRGDYLFTLEDLMKTDYTETDTKDHIEVFTLESTTKDIAEILQMLNPTLEYTAEDGYTGVLTLNHTSIEVEAAGYSNRSYTVSATRTYPNLSDADLSLVPKSIEENGRTLTLADVDWQSEQNGSVLRYNATASYTGTASSKYATGYLVTVEYQGPITKISQDAIVYTAVFSGAKLIADVEDAPTPMSVYTTYILLVVAVLVIAALASYLLHLNNKKKKQVGGQAV